MSKTTRTVLFLLGVALLALCVGCGSKAKQQADKNEPAKPETALKPLPPPVDLNEMVFIPAGECVIGGAPAAPANLPKGSPEEGTFNFSKFSAPAHKVNLKAFWIDKYEVSFKQYIEFALATKYKSQGNWKKYYDDRMNSMEPVIGMTLKDAEEYAKWAKKRLPTNEEWEKAASWDEKEKKQVRFPWGNEWKDNAANTSESGQNLAEVGVYKNDVSPYGVHDMLGNAFEWTSSFYEMYPKCTEKDITFGKRHYVVKGASYSLVGKDWYMTLRSHFDPTFECGQGFRCVKNATPEEEKQAPGK